MCITWCPIKSIFFYPHCFHQYLCISKIISLDLISLSISWFMYNNHYCHSSMHIHHIFISHYNLWPSHLLKCQPYCIRSLSLLFDSNFSMAISRMYSEWSWWVWHIHSMETLTSSRGRNAENWKSCNQPIDLQRCNICVQQRLTMNLQEYLSQSIIINAVYLTKSQQSIYYLHQCEW